MATGQQALGCSAPKIAIVPFPKYSHGFPIHCLDRFAHADDDDLYPAAENQEDISDDVIWQSWRMMTMNMIMMNMSTMNMKMMMMMNNEHEDHEDDDDDGFQF